MSLLSGLSTLMFISFPGHMELVIILVVVLLIFGPKNLPKLGSAIGGFARNLKQGKEGHEIEEDEFAEEEPRPRRSRDTEPKG